MRFLKNLWKRKKEVKKKEEVKTEKTLLEIICAGEPEIYEALRDTIHYIPLYNIFLDSIDPREFTLSLEEAIKNAKKFKKRKSKRKALWWYKIAGGLAIFEGNIDKVKECFGRCAEMDSRFNSKILEERITKRAIAKAQEYCEEWVKIMPHHKRESANKSREEQSSSRFYFMEKCCLFRASLDKI